MSALTEKRNSQGASLMSTRSRYCRNYVAKPSSANSDPRNSSRVHVFDAQFVVEMSFLRNNGRSVATKNLLLPVWPEFGIVGRTLTLQKLQPFVCKHMRVDVDHWHFSFIRRQPPDRVADY